MSDKQPKHRGESDGPGCPVSSMLQARSELPGPTGSVFEIVAYPNDETYYEQGVWQTLEEATKALDECTPDDFDCWCGFEEWAKAEIRERPFGWGSSKLITSRTWEATYDDKTDELTWHVLAPNNQALRTQNELKN